MSTRSAPQPGPTSLGQGALQAIFAVFLGLVITAFVGVGVYTFYPNPGENTEQQVSQLYQQQNAINQCDQPGGCKANSELTQAERDELERLDKQIRALEQANQAVMQRWAQRTSLILVVVATILLAISLALGQSVTAISNGVLLGGLFTMLYAVGWGIASGSSIGRFLVLSAALAISLGLGYLRFTRHRAVVTAAPAASGAVAPVASDAQLEARVSDLERRLAAAAAWLGTPASAPATPVVPPFGPTSDAVPQSGTERPAVGQQTGPSA